MVMKRGIRFIYLRHLNLTPVRNLDCTSSLQPAPVLLHLSVCSYGTSIGRKHESLYKWSMSHDQDGRHAHGKNHKNNLLLLKRRINFNETCYVALGTLAYYSLHKS